MRVKLLLVAGLHHGGIAPGASQRDHHRLVEQLEALHLLDGCHGRLRVLEHDKGLALGLQICLGHDIDHVTIFGEDGAQGLLEGFRFDALLEIAYVNPAN